MIKHKLFFSLTAQKQFLDTMNKKGYELIGAAPFTYKFEKTNRAVCYQFIPVKGRNGYLALDYKNKDKNAKAIYAKSDVVLFKKIADKGDFTIISENELKLRLAKRKSKNYNLSLCLIALGILMATLGSRVSSLPLTLLSVIVLVLSFIMMITSKK